MTMSDGADEDRGEAATEPFNVTPSTLSDAPTLSDMPDWPGREAPRRAPSRSLSRRLLDDLHRPRPVQSRELVGLLLSLVVGLVLVSLLLTAVTPALFSSLFSRFTGIPQRSGVSHVSTAPAAPK